VRKVPTRDPTGLLNTTRAWARTIGGVPRRTTLEAGRVVTVLAGGCRIPVTGMRIGSAHGVHYPTDATTLLDNRCRNLVVLFGIFHDDHVLVASIAAPGKRERGLREALFIQRGICWAETIPAPTTSSVNIQRLSMTASLPR